MVTKWFGESDPAFSGMPNKRHVTTSLPNVSAAVRYLHARILAGHPFVAVCNLGKGVNMFAASGVIGGAHYLHVRRNALSAHGGPVMLANYAVQVQNGKVLLTLQ